MGYFPRKVFPFIPFFFINGGSAQTGFFYSRFSSCKWSNRPSLLEWMYTGDCRLRQWQPMEKFVSLLTRTWSWAPIGFRESAHLYLHLIRADVKRSRAAVWFGFISPSTEIAGKQYQNRKICLLSQWVNKEKRREPGEMTSCKSILRYILSVNW